MESVHLSPHCRHEPRRRRVVRRFSFLWVNPSRAFPSPANDSAGWKWELKGFQGFRAFTRPRKNQVFIRETRHEQPLDNARNLTFTLIAAFCHAIFRENNLRRGRAKNQSIACVEKAARNFPNQLACHFSLEACRLSLSERNFSTSQRIIPLFRFGAVYLRFFYVGRISYISPSRAINTSFQSRPLSSSQFLLANLRYTATVARDLRQTAAIIELQEPSWLFTTCSIVTC